MCAFQYRMGFGRSLADKASDERGAVGLDELSFGHDAHGAIDLTQQPGNGGFTCSGITGKYQMVAGF